MSLSVPISQEVSRRLGVAERSVLATLELFSEGATVPFVARYRKERTGGLDEEQLREIATLTETLTELEERREAILRSLRERELLTPELEKAIEAAAEKRSLEDLYLPYRPRRQTLADRAREQGLGALGEAFFARPEAPLQALLERHCPAELSVAEAQDGLRAIVAETLANDPALRGELRELFARQGALESGRARGSGGADTYRDYFSWRERASRAPSHRILAILRGVSEGVLSVTLRPPEAEAVQAVLRRLPRGSADHERLAFNLACAEDGWKRLLLPALEREALNGLRDGAVETAISLFRKNLETVLLAAPFGPQPVLAIDPGFVSGCKWAYLDATGEVLETGKIEPLAPHNRSTQAAEMIRGVCERREVRAFAVGDGTGGRETELFLREHVLAGGCPGEPAVISVHEAGASVYSASPYARQELPHLAVEYRGAVSIGRRLQDPLAELVKVDPASIGVGQYQHDIDPRKLGKALDATVESCVNRVGVEINTASVPLLSRVAGLSARNAGEILRYREKEGLFRRRRDITKVTGIGARTVEQAIGFLRCREAADPLDDTGIHPERYSLVEQIAGDLGVPVAELRGNETVLDRIEPQRYLTEETGLPTITDIIAELRRPGRDPRPRFSSHTFAEGVHSIADLAEGMELNGIVRNVAAFGAFVDIGVHRDGLVHVSAMAERYVSDPTTVVRPGQWVRVRVTAIDQERNRIELSMKGVSPVESAQDGAGEGNPAQ